MSDAGRGPEDLLLDAAAEGALVLTATRRLARRLRTLYDRRQVAAGRGAWPTPAIHSGDDWLQRAAELLGEGWRLLGPQASRRLWEQIIEAGEREAGGLLQVAASARAAEEAHLLLDEYRLEITGYPPAADHLAFRRWRQSYLATCQRAGWWDRSALATAVTAAVHAVEIPSPASLWLAGFDDLPPRFVRIAEAFRLRGEKVHELPLADPIPAVRRRLPCADRREEVRLAARWTRRLLEAGEGEIGIVVTDMEGYRPLLERIFREEIDPASMLRPAGEEARFNLSLGGPLADAGAVAAALEILGAGRELPLPTASFLLRSPYLGGAEGEWGARARLEKKLREKGEPVVQLASLAQGAGDGGEANPRGLSFALLCQRLLQFGREREARLPGVWAGRFALLLASVGWPGERPLDSLDFQAVKAWQEKVLPQLASFDLISGPVSRGEALALARRLAGEISFQPEGPESPVQVLGLLEAAGLRFRHLWVLGLHDGALPAPPRPNPFLPLPLQVEAGLPHASAEREAQFARRIAERLFSAAPSVILSHPLREKDATLLPSPLIRDLPAAEEILLAPSQAPALLWRAQAPPAEEVADLAGPPLTAGEIATGGTALLRDQALCPFRAFARHRLAAAALEVPDLGLDPRQRGNLLHKSLELFWRQTVDQAGLHRLDAAALGARIETAIEEAMQALFPAGSDRPLLTLERERLRLLIGEWLELEAGRPPFTVLESEGEHRTSLGGIEIVTRIDRVDRLDQGGLAVIDYKTGLAEAGDLVGERLLEPQLPVYGLGRGSELAAVAFARLRRGDCAFCGVGREGESLPKVKGVSDWSKAQQAGVGDWPALLERWRQQLEELGRDFAAGAAAVDPVDPAKACRLCDLTPLCRVAESGLVSEEGEG